MGSVLLRFWSSLFLTYEKGYKRKNFLGVLEIWKYALFDICKKEWGRKIGVGLFKICKYTFFKFEKEDKQKNWAIFF